MKRSAHATARASPSSASAYGSGERRIPRRALDERAERENRDESSLERLDRNLEEMTGELRVVVTGVQVLFAFLLIVPFDTGFAHIGRFEQIVYVVTLVLAALSAVCMLAPSAEHRFLFRQDDKRHLVFVANRTMIAGLLFLALAMCGCVLLVTTKLFGVAVAVPITCVVAAPFAVLWFLAPLNRAKQHQGRGRPAGKRWQHSV
jgi:Family of unknown function (DUF6328)